MKFRELVKQSYEDLKNLTVTWYNVIALAMIVIVLSVVTTPIIGIQAGLLLLIKSSFLNDMLR